MKRWIVALLFCFNAHAVTFSTDNSDLWWDPAEPGYGLNVVQQGDTLFLTLFTYNAARAPLWLVGTEIKYVGPVGSGYQFGGKWYQTTGSPHTGPYLPTAFSLREVGTATFTVKSQNSATLVYTIDGVTVTRNLVRQTYKVNNLTGNFLGATVGTYGNCLTLNSYSEDIGFVAVAHDPSTNAITITAQQAGGTCTYSGTYEPTGRLGSISSGLFSCTNGGLAGTFIATEIEGSTLSFSTRISARGAGQCTFIGKIGGLRQGP
ncbi:hypothetical protein BWI17_00365 [Betaproteobacteria bacterium GR16-43]|nr:hypothetical protein BWI17_00365 [Betaproteobacteria bacterium GR16-43]